MHLPAFRRVARHGLQHYWLYFRFSSKQITKPLKELLLPFYLETSLFKASQPPCAFILDVKYHNTSYLLLQICLPHTTFLHTVYTSDKAEHVLKSNLLFKYLPDA